MGPDHLVSGSPYRPPPIEPPVSGWESERPYQPPTSPPPTSPPPISQPVPDPVIRPRSIPRCWPPGPWPTEFPFDEARAASDAARELADCLDLVRRRLMGAHEDVARDHPEGVFADRFRHDAGELEDRLLTAVNDLTHQADEIDLEIKEAT